VEHIHSLLADGGIWINLGPLLYHYSDSPDVDSTELSYSELRLLVLHYGFEIKEEVPQSYALQPLYACVIKPHVARLLGCRGVRVAVKSETYVCV
jgi:hypothetical protein